MGKFEIYLEGSIFIAFEMSTKNESGLSNETLLFKRIIAKERRDYYNRENTVMIRSESTTKIFLKAEKRLFISRVKEDTSIDKQNLWQWCWRNSGKAPWGLPGKGSHCGQPILRRN